MVRPKLYWPYHLRRPCSLVLYWCWVTSVLTNECAEWRGVLKAVEQALRSAEQMGTVGVANEKENVEDHHCDAGEDHKYPRKRETAGEEK